MSSSPASISGPSAIFPRVCACSAYASSAARPTSSPWYFEASGPLPGDVQFVISAHVESAPSFSLVPPDELAWNVGMPFAIPTSLWRQGYVYESVTELMRRPGRERYSGSFQGPGAPNPIAGTRETTLAVLD